MMWLMTACADSQRVHLALEPIDETSQFLIRTDTPVGTMRLWLPEGIASNEGFSAIYPVGTWEGDATRLEQHVTPERAFGRGNFDIRSESVACAGIVVPRDQPVAWSAAARVDGPRVRFEIRLRNLGQRPIARAAAPICLKFADAAWWRPERVYVRSGGREVTLGALGEKAGQAPGFEAFLLVDHQFDNRFYHAFWGIHPARLDEPVMVSHHPQGWRVGITAERAILLHSNRLNPCTDIMLAFGDVPPGVTAVSRGMVWMEQSRDRKGAVPAEPRP